MYRIQSGLKKKKIGYDIIIWENNSGRAIHGHGEQSRCRSAFFLYVEKNLFLLSPDGNRGKYDM